jgi:hypothetical protein
MAYSKIYTEEIDLVDLLKILKKLGFESPTDINTEKKNTTFKSKNKSGVQFEFSIENKYTLKFDLTPPFSWMRRILQVVLAIIALLFCEILKKESGIILGAIPKVLLLALAVSIPNLSDKYFYKAKNQEELNILAEQLDNLDNEEQI